MDTGSLYIFVSVYYHVLLYGWWKIMGFRGQYHPVHIVCDMDRVRSNIIFCEKKKYFEQLKLS